MNRKLPLILLLTFCLIFTIPSIKAEEGDYTGTHWNTDSCSGPGGICTDDNYIWIVNIDNDGVAKYTMTGTYISTWYLHANNDFPTGGITTDGTNIWVAEYLFIIEGAVYKYQMDGTYVTNWATYADIGHYGLTTDGTNIWGSKADKVYKYNMAGGYVSTTSLSPHIDDAKGMATDDTNIWIVNQSEKAYKFDMSLVHQSNWTLGASGPSYGIEVDDCNFYVTDHMGDEVYVYNNDDTPPSPSPSTWSVEPTELSTTEITMTATAATDNCCTIYFYFDETTGNPGGTDSGWQLSNVYTDSGLRNNTQYTYKVWTKDCRNNHGLNSSSKSATTKKFIYTYSTYSVQHDSATLDAFGYDITGDVGFYFGNNTVSQSAFDQNYTIYSGRVDWTGAFIKVVPTNQSTYYHAMAWYSADDGWFYTGDEVFFITPPESPPSNFTVNQTGYTWLNLTWDNEFFEHTSANQSTVIKYSVNTYPVWATGYELYNGTAEYCNTTGIVSIGFDTTVYFSAWTYVNDSSSPVLWTISPSPSHASGRTLSGLYNITIRWENSTYGKIPLDDPSRTYHEHKFFIYYATGYEENYYEEVKGWYITDTPNFVDAVISDGNWTIQITRQPREMLFEWKGDSAWYYFWHTADICSRTLVMDQVTNNNVTFYLRTDLNYVPIFLGGIVDWMNKSSLGEYTYEFIDNHGSFSYADNPYVYIYTYDKDGNRLIIHSEYLDRSMEITPTLVFGKTYYLGIKSDLAEITYIGKAPTGTDGHPIIIIPRDIIYDYSIFDHINVDVGATDTQIYIDFTDTTFSTVECSIEIVHYLNGTQVYTESTTLDSYNFTFTTLDGYDNTLNYAWRLNITFQTLGSFTTGFIPIYASINYTLITPDDVNTIFTLMFGPTPVVLSTGVGVSYAYLCVLIFGLLGLLTFKPEQAHIGLAVEGLIFMLSAGAMAGLNNIFSNYSWQQGVALGAVGFFLLLLGIWASLGGKKKEDKE